MTRKPIVTRFHLFGLVVLLVVMGTAFIKIPAGHDFPIHWDYYGKPDQFWARIPALLTFPIIGLVLTALFALIGRLAPVTRVEPGRHMSEALLTGLLGLLCALEFSLLMIGVGTDLDPIRGICFAVAAFLAILGAVLPRSERNSINGLRLPWTPTNPRNWRASHWVTGILFAIGGIGLFLVAFFEPAPTVMLIVLGAAIFLPIVLGASFTFVRSKL